MIQSNLVEIITLKKYFPIEPGLFRHVSGYIRAVDDVTLSVRKGETLGLVGESGCGKTTLGRCILRAITPTAGKILFQRSNHETVDIVTLKDAQLRSVRKDMQMIFQDPYSSLDPRMSVLDIIGEPIWANNIARGEELEYKVRELADIVGLNTKHLKRYPHAFSGGQRQRIGIARALSTNPQFIVADEPVSALDVSIRAQILNLLQNLQQKFDLTYLFISHDLSVIQYVSDKVAVMYVGKIVELAETDELFFSPKHPYTEALLSAVPKANPHIKMKRIILPGEVPNPANPPSGCTFHPRCLYAERICQEEEPELRKIGVSRTVACHFAEKLNLQGVSD